MSSSGSRGTLTVWLAKNEQVANPTTHAMEAVVAPVEVLLAEAFMVVTVVAVVVGREVVGLVAAGEFQPESIGNFSLIQGVTI